jgi:thiamine-monophosphate kinase
MAQLRPEPPLAAGAAALAAGATAGMDLSDGLARDLPRLAAASGVTLAIDLADLPPDPALAHLSAAARAAGGEDYGLLVTGPASTAEALRGLGFTRIGEVLACPAGTPAAVRWAEGGLPIAAPMPEWEHF